jgi:hypothetical protein
MATTHTKCRTWRCGYQIPADRDHCPDCGIPRRLWGRLLTRVGLASKRPNLRHSEREAWKVIDAARDEMQKLVDLEGDLTGFHKPKMTDQQKEALGRAKAHIARKAFPGLERLKAIEAARWQNGWVPVVMRLADERFSDKQLAEIDEQLYRHTRLGSALKKRWERGIPGYEALWDRKVKSLEPSIFRLAVTIIRIREWVSVRRTIGVLGEVSALQEVDGAPTLEGLPPHEMSEWLETVYDRDEELEKLTQETLRWEAEEDVNRLLE